MSARRVAIVSTAAFAGVGLLRALVQLSAAAHPLRVDALIVASTLTTSLFWVPIAVWTAVTRARSSTRLQRVASHGFALLLVTFAEPAWVDFVLITIRRAPARWSYLTMLVGRLDTNLLFYAAIVGAIWATENARRQGAIQIAAARLESALADARLHVLTLQLHPHFLFNTLNLISQLAYRDRVAARRTLANLRALLVQSLELAGRRDVALRDELRFLNAYLEIQQRRFGSRLRVRLDVDDAALDAAVPNMVLQPLVENAIAHGIGDRERGGEIVVTARVTEGRLRLLVEDDGVGPRRQPVHEGVGLSNTRLRLHQLSNGDYDFNFARRAGGGAVVSISVPFTTAAADVAASGADQTVEVRDTATLRPPPSRARIALQMVAGWAAIAMAWTELDTMSRIGMHEPAAWRTSLLASVINATIWAALVPPIVWMSRRFDLSSGWSRSRIAAHLAGAAAAAATHVALFLSMLHEFVPADYSIELANSYAWALWDLGAYAAVLSFSTVVTLGARHRESRAAIALTHSRLAQARLASMRMHLQPGVLLAGLEAIDRSLLLDPAVAERSITRMGDLLRLLLARGDRDTVSLGSEIAALRAYLDVMSSNADVDVDDSLYDAALPSVLLTPLAASMTSVSAVSVHPDDAALHIELRSRNPEIDEALVGAVRDRLNVCLGTRWTLATRIDAGATITLRVPLVAWSEWSVAGTDAIPQMRSA